MTCSSSFIRCEGRDDNHLIGSERLADPHWEAQGRRSRDRLIGSDRIKNLYGSVPGDDDQDDGACCYVGQFDLNDALVAMQPVVGPYLDHLRGVDRHLL
jgi:hypothetical protein